MPHNDSKGSQSVSNQVADQKMKSAGARAMECHQRVRAKAEALIEEIDDLTPVHGVPAVIGPEDSIVTSIAAVLAQNTGK